MKHSVFSVGLLSWWALVSTCAAAAAAEIESFSPAGFTKDVRQVAVRFSAPMVALGDPDRRHPFTVRCATPGTGRWIDERHWVYDFEHEVPGAERCTFTLRRGVRTLAGEAIAGPRLRSFHTGGPTILASHASGGSRPIDERQVFLLALDARADGQSIERYARCRVAGQADAIGVTVVRAPSAPRYSRRYGTTSSISSTTWSKGQKRISPAKMASPTGSVQCSASSWCAAGRHCPTAPVSSSSGAAAWRA